MIPSPRRLSGTERETLTNGDSLINAKPFLRATSARFSELLLCLPFLKDTQIKIILLPQEPSAPFGIGGDNIRG